MTHHQGALADHLIAAGPRHTLGNNEGQCEVSSWREIVAVSAGFRHTLGLRADGTVLAAGSNEHGLCDVAGWPPIRR